MASVNFGGSASGLLIYTGNDNNSERVVVSHITAYRKMQNGSFSIYVETPKSTYKFDMDSETDANTVLTLLDARF